LLETLVQPIKQNNQTLISTYETLLTSTDIQLLPINRDILRESANLRATENLKTPDAIHTATAFSANCEYLITNDNGFKRLLNINVIILSELI
jgi:predicted nucleic acid-binding protein